MTRFEKWKAVLTVDDFVDILYGMTMGENCELCVVRNYCKYESKMNCKKYLTNWANEEVGDE